ELDIPRRTDRGRYQARRGAANGRIRKVELRMIERVEKLRAELQTRALLNMRLFEKGAIEVSTMRSAKRVSAAVTVGVLKVRCPGGARHVEGGVEPMRDRGVR